MSACMYMAWELNCAADFRGPGPSHSLKMHQLSSLTGRTNANTSTHGLVELPLRPKAPDFKTQALGCALAEQGQRECKSQENAELSQKSHVLSQKYRTVPKTSKNTMFYELQPGPVWPGQA